MNGNLSYLASGIVNIVLVVLVVVLFMIGCTDSSSEKEMRQEKMRRRSLLHGILIPIFIYLDEEDSQGRLETDQVRHARRESAEDATL